MKHIFSFLALGAVAASGFAGDIYQVRAEAEFTYSSYYPEFGDLPKKISCTSFDVYRLRGESQEKVGRIEKPAPGWLTGWTRNYAYFERGNLFSSATARAFSMGALKDCLKVFDFFDANGQKIGSIEGTYWTDNAAEFTFYSLSGAVAGTVRVDPSYNEIRILGIGGENHVIASLRKVSNGSYNPYWGASYAWEVDHIDPRALDRRLIWPFVGFLAEVWWTSY